MKCYYRSVKMLIFLLLILLITAQGKQYNLQEYKINNPCINGNPEETVDLSQMNMHTVKHNIIVSSHIKGLDLSHNYIREMEKESFQKLTNLTYLDISRNDLNAEYFLFNIFPKLELSNLKTLVAGYLVKSPPYDYNRNIYNNNQDVINSTSNVEILCFEGNNIENVFSNWSFFGTKLKYLSLEGNRLSTVTSVNFPASLIYLDLSSNELYQLNIIELSNLKFLDLSDNKRLLRICNNNCDVPLNMEELINKVQGYYLYTDYGLYNHNSFFNSKNLFSLKYFYASNNNMLTIDTDAFIDTYNLITLDLSSNNLKLIADQVFINLTALRYLYLNKNQITHIPNVHKLISLKILDLSQNRIKNVSSGSFNSLLNLRILRLNNNEIHIVEEKAFENLNSLKELDLSDNMLHALQENWIFPQNSMKILLLQSNKLNRFDEISLSNVNSLTDLYLYNNTFHIIGILHVQSLTNLPKNITLHLDLKSVDTILT